MGLVNEQENEENAAPAAESDPLQENDPWQNQQSQQQQPPLLAQPTSELERVPMVLTDIDQLVMPTVMPMPTTTEVFDSVENLIASFDAIRIMDLGPQQLADIVWAFARKGFT